MSREYSFDCLEDAMLKAVDSGNRKRIKCSLQSAFRIAFSGLELSCVDQWFNRFMLLHAELFER